MPLTELETFKTKLERRNRIEIPRLLRWRYKMEPGELLTVSLKPLDSRSYEEERFLAKMTSDGRLTVPKLTMQILQQREEKNLTGAILEITIRPAGASIDAAPRESAETDMLGKIKDIRKSLG